MARIDGRTEIYGIIGSPVSHSLSPAMHNRAFAALSLNKVYVPFEVKDLAPALAGLKALGVRGISVTIPYKEEVVSHLDSIDPMAGRIGAVNTLSFEGGRVHGFNTDWLGANRALSQALELPGSRILLLGAGGAARAIGFGLQEAGAQVLLASRTPKRGLRLAEELGCEWHALGQLGGIRADGLVNATSVGMTPNPAASPVAGLDLAPFRVVMDIVYSPLETRLLREAARAGCRVIDGLEMLLFQGVSQFEAWTGQAAPLAEMRAELRARITN